VPIEFEHTLVQALNENNIMRTIGCKIITTQNERKIPVANGHTQAAWTAENGAYTESNPTFSQTSIDAFKLTDLIKVSDELLSDSFFDIEGYISEEFGRAFGEAEEDAFINGAIQSGADCYRQTDRSVYRIQCGRCSFRRDRSLRHGHHCR
jgi:HK97 family phage major capsid protein